MLRILKNSALLSLLFALASVSDAREVPHAGTADIQVLPKRLFNFGPNLNRAPNPRVAENEPTHHNGRSMLFFVNPALDCPDKCSIISSLDGFFQDFLNTEINLGELVRKKLHLKKLYKTK